MWGEKPYYSLDYYLKETFGGKVYKLALNGGMSCPNRDGTLGNGGCIFCSAGGSGEFAAPAALPVREQLAYGRAHLHKRVCSDKYIAYFQAYTNTYAPVDYLRQIYTEALEEPDVVAMSVATRPDCLGEDVIALLAELNRIKPVWVELGLQTIHEQTAEYIRRGYPLECFADAVRRLRTAGLAVIVHVILGLPRETKADMLETVAYLNNMDIQGVKLQLLHVLEGTALAEDFRRGEFEVLELDEYAQLVVDCIAEISPEIVIHRITGDGLSEQLIAPLWSRKKISVQNRIHHMLKVQRVTQGCRYKKGGLLCCRKQEHYTS